MTPSTQLLDRLQHLEAEAEAACAARDAAQAEVTHAAEAAANAEKAAAEAEAKGDLRALTARMALCADEADAAFAVFLAKLREAQSAEAEARKLSAASLGRPTFSGAVIPSAAADYATLLRSLLTGAPQGLQPFTATRAALAVKRVLAGAGL